MLLINAVARMLWYFLHFFHQNVNQAFQVFVSGASQFQQCFSHLSSAKKNQTHKREENEERRDVEGRRGKGKSSVCSVCKKEEEENFPEKKTSLKSDCGSRTLAPFSLQKNALEMETELVVRHIVQWAASRGITLKRFEGENIFDEAARMCSPPYIQKIFGLEYPELTVSTEIIAEKALHEMWIAFSKS
jgi:hypothetical protein